MNLVISERIALQTHGVVPVGVRVAGDYPSPAEIEARRNARDAEVAAKNYAEAVQAALSAPAPAVEEELPPLADDVYAAQKPAPVAASARPTLADAKARLAAKARAAACTIVSRPSAPASRPAPAPMPDRVPGKGEFYCLACPRRHVVAEKDLLVHSAAWVERHLEGRVPTLEELAELAVCGQAARVDRQLNWYPLPEVFGHIQRWVAEQAAAAEADRQKREARLAKFTPKAAQKPNARGETRLSLDQAGGWAALGDKLKPKK